VTRTLIGFAVVLLVLVFAGESLRRAALIEERLAQADEELTTTARVAPETAASLDESVDFLARVPVLGDRVAADVRRQRAEASYWQHDYAALQATPSPSGTPAAPGDARLMLLSANAAFRSAVVENRTPQTLARGLDDVIKAYGEVLKVDPESNDASYNYEYAVRLRTILAAGRGASVPEPQNTNMQGEEGEPPKGSRQTDFNVIVPLRPDERQEQMDPGAGADFKRQG
jgi:hypothetical protein